MEGVKNNPRTFPCKLGIFEIILDKEICFELQLINSRIFRNSKVKRPRISGQRRGKGITVK